MREREREREENLTWCKLKVMLAKFTKPAAYMRNKKSKHQNTCTGLSTLIYRTSAANNIITFNLVCSVHCIYAYMYMYMYTVHVYIQSSCTCFYMQQFCNPKYSILYGTLIYL